MKKLFVSSLLLFSLILSAVVLAAPAFVGTLSHNGTDNFYYDGENVYFSVNVSEVNATMIGTDATNIYINCTYLNGSTSGVVGTYVAGDNLTNTQFLFTCPLNYSNTQLSADDYFESIIGGNFTVIAINGSGDGNNNTYYNGAVIAYNFTLPFNQTGLLGFGSLTTDLSAVANFESVNYILDIELNGNTLPGTPWNGFQRAALFNFTSLNFTDPTTGPKLANLASSVNVNISAKRTYGANRIYVDTATISELNSNTTITLYNLPFTSQPSIVADAAAAGGEQVVSWVGGELTGNLTFNVSGFSGYNVSDNVNPSITAHDPAQNNLTGDTTPLFNFTFNGTGTEINNESILVTITGTATHYINYTNMACEMIGTESIRCYNNTLTLADGNYNIAARAADYGGTAGNTNTTNVLNLTIDTTAPSVTATVPATSTWYSGNMLVTATITDSGNMASASYRVLNSSGLQVKDWTALTAYGTTYNATLDTSTLSDMANYTFIFNATDSIGNTNTTVNVTLVGLDNLDPATTYINVSSITATGGTLLVTVTDATSGIASCTYAGAGTGNLALSTGNNYTATLSGLSATTNYNVSVNCTDNAGNSNSSLSQNFTTIAAAAVEETTTAATSSSTSGGGGSVSKSLSGQYAQQVWGYLNKGELAELSIENGEIGFTGVEFNAKKKLYTSNMKVIKLAQLPSSVDSYDKPTYKYIEVRTGNLGENDIENARISFKVTKAWLSENNLESSQIALFRYVIGQWVKLETTLGEDDGEYVHYTASTPGFSYFAIAASEEPAASAPVETPVETPTETIPPEPTAAEKVAELAKSTGSKIFLVILALAIIAALVYFLVIRKNQRHKPHHFGF